MYYNTIGVQQLSECYSWLTDFYFSWLCQFKYFVIDIIAKVGHIPFVRSKIEQVQN